MNEVSYFPVKLILNFDFKFVTKAIDEINAYCTLINLNLSTGK